MARRVGIVVKEFREIVERVKGRQTVDLSNYRQLLEEVNYLLRINGEGLFSVDTNSDVTRLSGALNVVDSLALDSNEEVIMSAKEEEVVVGAEPDLSSKVDRGVIDALMDDYDEYLAKHGEKIDLNKLADKYKINRQTVKDLIERKQAIQAGLEAKLAKENTRIGKEEAVVVARELSNKLVEIEVVSGKITVEKIQEDLIEIVLEGDDGEVEKSLAKIDRSVREQIREAVVVARVEREIEAQTKEILRLGVEKKHEELIREMVRSVYVNSNQRPEEVSAVLKKEGIDNVDVIGTRLKEITTRASQANEIRIEYSAETEARRVLSAYIEVNPNITWSQIKVVADYTEALREVSLQLPRVDLDPTEVNNAGPEKIWQMDNLRTGEVLDPIEKAKAVIQLLKSDKGIVGRLFQARAILTESSLERPNLLGKMVTARAHYVGQLAEIINRTPGMAEAFRYAQRVVAFRDRIAGVAGGQLVGGIAKLGITQIGGISTVKFASLAVRLVKIHGQQSGTLMLFAGMARLGAMAAEKGLKKTVLSGLSKVLVKMAGSSAGGPLTLVMMAAMVVGEWLIGKVGGLANKINEKFGGLWTRGIQSGIKKTIGKIPVIGDTVAKTANLALSLGEFLLKGVGLALGVILAAPLAIIIIGVFVGMFILQIFTGGMVSSLVPPVGLGGGNTNQYNNGLPPEGWQTTPVNLPDWQGGPIAVGCPQGIPVTGGRLTQGPFAPGCSHQNEMAIDIGVAGGTPIRAINDGRATASYDSIYGFSVRVQANCNNKVYSTLYGHMIGMSFTGVKQVKAGDVIGYVDNTGNSTGNHLHLGAPGLGVSEFLKDIGADYNKAQQIYQCCIDNGKICPNL